MKYAMLFLLCTGICTSALAQNLPENRHGQAGNSGMPDPNSGEIWPRAPMSSGWNITAGPSAMIGPRFLGTSAVKFLPVPTIEISDGDRFTLSAYRGARYEVIKGGSLSLGPLVRPSFGRSQSETDKYLPGLSKIGFAPEVGGFAKVSLNRNVSISTEVRKALGGHDGVIAEIGANYTKRTGKVIAGFGPKLTLANAKYMRRNFGVTLLEAQQSAFAAFAPKGGLRGVGADGFAAFTIGGGKSLGVFASYERLGGAIGDSSIFEAPKGARDQFRIGVSFSFTVIGKAPRS